MNAKTGRWRTINLAPSDIDLDRKNPRINVEPNDKESDIILKLLRYEEVTELARKIARGGLLPGERIIVCKEGSRYVVLEGNRRVCACKLLLNPSLVPTEYKKQFPKLTSAAEQAKIRSISADVAPTRKAAEHILTLRHTEPGIRKWKPIARMRRVQRLLDEGLTIDEIATEYEASPSNIRKTIREHRLLQLAHHLKGLSKSERQRLDDPDLQTNPFTRFFELQGVKDYLNLSFNPNANEAIVISGKKREFAARFRKIVDALLLRDGAISPFDTRTRPDEILGGEFAKFAERKEEAAKKRAKAAKKSEKERATRRPSTRRPDSFFENLICRVNDNALASVTIEIAKIDPAVHPISGTYLLRTITELCLYRLIKIARKKLPGSKDPALTELVNFSLNNRDVFPVKRLGEVIETARNQKSFDYLNIVVHQRWMEADPKTLVSVANLLRTFVTYVVTET